SATRSSAACSRSTASAPPRSSCSAAHLPAAHSTNMTTSTRRIPMTDSAAVRSALVDVLRRDLISPNPDDADLATETLKERPSRWYLTGYLVPLNAPEEQREGTTGGDDSLDSGAEEAG